MIAKPNPSMDDRRIFTILTRGNLGFPSSKRFLPIPSYSKSHALRYGELAWNALCWHLKDLHGQNKTVHWTYPGLLASSPFRNGHWPFSSAWCIICEDKLAATFLVDKLPGLGGLQLPKLLPNLSIRLKLLSTKWL